MIEGCKGRDQTLCNCRIVLASWRTFLLCQMKSRTAASENLPSDCQRCKVSSCGQRILWSNCADVQNDFRGSWTYMSGGTFSNVASQPNCVYEFLLQSNLNSSNLDDSFPMANSNSFLSPYEFIPIAQESEIFLFYHEFVCYVYSLESPHRGDSNEYTQYTIFVEKIKKSLNYCHLPPDLLSWLTINDSNYPYLEQMSMVPKMFEPLRFDCNCNTLKRKARLAKNISEMKDLDKPCIFMQIWSVHVSDKN